MQLFQQGWAWPKLGKREENYVLGSFCINEKNEAYPIKYVGWSKLKVLFSWVFSPKSAEALWDLWYVNDSSLMISVEILVNIAQNSTQLEF